ncbi:L-threonylcarbamoyladenylate synthase [Halopenitus malekzadehii]|uniref:L-threonylcarbamoyladenylate synthase n=1 Tax=Halopenitus malekzadehii TaxID=1267564 RepID=A0A1H6HVK7_9EURY|nr:L-threonylcarbamoyladenylate synthase [Halopenitus malekzadehii]SEH38152.1 L-threonylcarbamoyladenylate synthase [Halopenitus malekzadehii]
MDDQPRTAERTSSAESAEPAEPAAAREALPKDVRSTIDRAATAIADGDLVVYPTETVYGLGADALAPDAVERVFETKGRDRAKPLSFGVDSVDTALEHTRPTELEAACLREFLPGPVTVIVERAATVPDVLTAGRDRVGIRIPDHPIALALCDAAGPITATSANRSGTGSVRNLSALNPEIRDAVAVLIDGGETPGTESTVVEPETGTIHRRGANADAIAAWLDDR